MDNERRQQWMEHKAEEVSSEVDVTCLQFLPQDVQTAIKGLVAHAFTRGYGWGFNDGRVFTGTGREPTYYVPKPVVEIVSEPRDVA